MRTLLVCLLVLAACKPGEMIPPDGPGGGMGMGGAGGGATAGGMGGSGGTGGMGGMAACSTPSVGEMPMRRLRRAEYDRTVHALFAGLAEPSYAATFPTEEQSFGFDNQANQSISQLHLERWMEASERITAELNLPQVTGCAAIDDACATAFIASVGPKIFRRALTQPEKDRYAALYTSAKAAETADVALRVVLQAMLQSLPFMHRLELSQGSEPAGVVPLTDAEMASRLSYFFWGAPPDATLAAAPLQTADQVEAQARRLLADPKARATIDDFHAQWFDLGDMALTFKSSPTPGENRLFNLAKDALVEETRALMADVFFNGKAPQLFSATHTFNNVKLANYYGIPAPATPGLRTELDPAQRKGVLSRGAFLSIKAKPNKTSPLHRGLFIRERLMCQSLGSPPPGIPPLPDQPAAGQTNRDLFAAHSASPACSGCHQKMEPVGFGLENYNLMGRWQTMEAGKTIDASGEFLVAGELDGPFSGPQALFAKLETSTTVRACMAKQWFRYGLGRGELPADDCARAKLEARFEETGGDFKELLIALTRSDSFRYRRSHP